MNKKIFLAIAIFVVVLLLTFLVRITQSQELTFIPSQSDPSIEQAQNQEEIGEASSSSSGVSLEELAKHNSKDSCWVAYKGKVYDVTSYLPRHPGGVKRIEDNCGTAEQFEDAFTKKHGTSKVRK
jgi:cytochrome b involved in lipid metabolism